MVVQGGAVRETLGAEHPLAPTLEALSGTGRQALGELRRLLGLLRDEHDVEHAPQPGLAMLGELAAQVQGSGLRVEIVRDGAGESLPAGHRAVGLPDRAGGPHERDPARRGRQRDRHRAPQRAGASWSR